MIFWIEISFLIISVTGLTCPSWYTQTCYNCRGSTSVCTVGTQFGITAAACDAYFDGVSILSIHYNPDNQGCGYYSCDGNTYYVNSNRYQLRRTTNTDCKTFTLSQTLYYYVTNTPYDTTTKSRGSCFTHCFDLDGCYTFSFDVSTGTCKRYVSCGTTCSTAYSGNFNHEIYVRTCQHECPALSSSDTYTVNMGCGRSEGDTAEYTCITGHTMSSGSTTTTCQSDGTWTDDPPTCTKENCGSPTSPSDGSVDSSAGTSYNDIATYNCKTGYTMTGSSTTTCQADGTWSNTAPTCTIKDCGSLTSPTDGSVDTSSGTQYDDTATYSCNAGYTLSGSSSTTCQADGTWSNGAPTCNIVDCGSPASISDGSLDTSAGTQYGDTATYTCNTGYTLSGSSTTTCQAEGTWSNGAPTCNIVNCGSPASISDGSLDTSAGTQYGDTATYTCNTGYTLSGSSTTTCQADGSWSNTAPSCSLVGCGALSPPAFGTVDTSAGTSYNDVATFSCYVGYTLSGPTSSTCQGDGTWSNMAPTCSPVDCSGLSNPSFGTVSTPSGTTYQNVAIYVCNFGYAMTGSSNRTCQADSQWGGSEPTCSLIDCGAPSAPTYGSVSMPSGSLLDDYALYSCNSGYFIVGDINRTCQSDNTWSGTVPLCSPNDCGALSDPVNGNVVAPNTTYGAVATYTCLTGYSIIGASSTTCGASSWEPATPPTCTLTDCGSLTNPANGLFTLSSGTTYGSVANYSCSSGYYLSHVQTRTCEATGQWSYTAPLCIQNGVVMTTPAPTRIFIMSCLCHTNNTFINMTQEEIIDQLVKDTAIATNSTALAKSKYISMTDPRESSRIMGLTGASVMGSVFGLIMLLDVVTLFRRQRM